MRFRFLLTYKFNFKPIIQDELVKQNSIKSDCEVVCMDG